MAESRSTLVRTEVTKALVTMVPDRLSDNPMIEGHQDLLEFVDSFGFVQLLMAVEEPLGIQLDLTTVDLGAIVRFDDLVKFICSSFDEHTASHMVDA